MTVAILTQIVAALERMSPPETTTTLLIGSDGKFALKYGSEPPRGFAVQDIAAELQLANRPGGSL